MAQLTKDVKGYSFYQLLDVQERKDAHQMMDSNRQTISHRSQPFYRASLRQRYSDMRKERNRTEIGYKREPKHCWSRRMYFIVTMMMGNGVDGLPLTAGISFELSAFVYVLVRFATTLIFLLPIMEVEVFMGKYSKLSDGQLYRMAPIGFGLCVMNFIFNMSYVPIYMTEIPVLLLGATKYLIHHQYMKSCVEGSKFQSPACFDFKVDGKLTNDTCILDYYSLQCEKNGRIAYVAQFYYWFDYYNNASVGGYDARAHMLGCCISWFILLSIILCGMKRIKMCFILSALFYLVIFIPIAIMVTCADGALKGILDLITLRQWPSVKTIGMAIALSTINLKLICPVGHMTYVSFMKQKKRQMNDCDKSALSSIVELLHFFYGAVHIIFLAMITGVLSTLYGIDNSLDMFIPRVGMFYAMVLEFLHQENVPLLFVIAYFLSLWILEISKLALVAHFQILNIFDFFPKVLQFNYYVTLGWGLISFGLTMVMTYKYCYWYLPTIHLANMYFIQEVRLLSLSFIFFYVYGIKRIEDDILFWTGKNVLKAFKILWPIYPILIVILIISMVFASFKDNDNDNPNLERNVPYNSHLHIFLTGFVVSACYIGGALFFEFMYILLGIGSTTTMSNLLKPDFHWGPFSKEERLKRKEFAPRIKIRSSRQRTRLQRFRPESIRQMHEKDLADAMQRGRVFLDSDFYTHCDIRLRTREAKPTRVRFSPNRTDQSAVFGML